MRVGLVTQPPDGVLPPRQNSIGLIMYHTAVQLARAVDVSLVYKRWSKEQETRSFPFTLEPIETPLDDLLGTLSARYPRWAERLGLREVADAYPNYARSVSARLRRRNCDVAHVMNYWQWCRILKSSGAAVVLEMQSEWLSQMDPGRVQAQLAATDAVVGVSAHIVNLFRKAFPDYRGIVATAYNGVDVETFRPAEPCGRWGTGDECRLLFVGRLSPEKGIHTLIEAFAEVARRRADCVLELAGPRTILPHRFLVGLSSDPLVRRLEVFYDGTLTGDYQRYLDELVARYQLDGRVRFLGPLPHRELVARYQSARLVVNPSLSESFGISIVEGMATGLPVVGTRVGGMAETIIHGETGYLVRPDSPAELASALCRVLENPDTAAAMGRRGRQRAVEHFSWAARARRLLEVYRQLRP